MNTQQPDPSDKPPIDKMRSWIAMARACLGQEMGGLEQDNIDHLEKLIEELAAKLERAERGWKNEAAMADHQAKACDRLGAERAILKAKLEAAEKELEELRKQKARPGWGN